MGIFGVQLPWSARGIASVDGGTESTVDTRQVVPDGKEHYRVPFYTASGLDPMQTHTLTFKYD